MSETLSPEQYFRSNKLGGKSVYWLSPNEYLAMSLPLRPGGDRGGAMLGRVKDLMRAIEMSPDNERMKLYDIPTLLISEDGQVIHHNGRHRARAFRDAGLEKIPVAFNVQGTFENAPPRLVSETGIFTMQAPWEAGPTGGEFPTPRPEYSSPTSRSPELPRPTPFGQSLIEEYGAISPQQSIEDYRENPDINPLRDQELEELQQRRKRIETRLSEIDEEGRRLFGGGDLWWFKSPEEEEAMPEELRKKYDALGDEQSDLHREQILTEGDQRYIDRRFQNAREKEILERWGEAPNPDRPYDRPSADRGYRALRDVQAAEQELRGTTPGTPEHRQAASKLALARQKANDIIGLPEAPRRTTVGDPRFPHLKLKKRLTPSEQRYFSEITDSPADRRELHEAGIRLSRDGKAVYIEDEDRALEYIDSTYISERRPGGPGTSTIPPSFRTGGRGSFASGIVDVAPDEYVELRWAETLRELGMRTEREREAARRAATADTPKSSQLDLPFDSPSSEPATPELTAEQRRQQQRIEEKAGELRREIYEQERRLSDLNPDTKSGRQARARIKAARAALRGLGRIAAVATGVGTILEGAAYAQDIAEEGPVQGTRTYVGESVLGSTGDLLQFPKAAAEQLPGYGERGVNLPAEALGAIGRGMGAVGRAIAGSDEEEEMMAVNPSAVEDEAPPTSMTMQEMRRQAASRAVERERARKE